MERLFASGKEASGHVRFGSDRETPRFHGNCMKSYTDVGSLKSRVLFLSLSVAVEKRRRTVLKYGLETIRRYARWNYSDVSPLQGRYRKGVKYKAQRNTKAAGLVMAARLKNLALARCAAVIPSMISALFAKQLTRRLMELRKSVLFTAFDTLQLPSGYRTKARYQQVAELPLAKPLGTVVVLKGVYHVSAGRKVKAEVLLEHGLLRLVSTTAQRWKMHAFQALRYGDELRKVGAVETCFAIAGKVMRHSVFVSWKREVAKAGLRSLLYHRSQAKNRSIPDKSLLLRILQKLERRYQRLELLALFAIQTFEYESISFASNYISLTDDSSAPQYTTDISVRNNSYPVFLRAEERLKSMKKEILNKWLVTATMTQSKRSRKQDFYGRFAFILGVACRRRRFISWNELKNADLRPLKLSKAVNKVGTKWAFRKLQKAKIVKKIHCVQMANALNFCKRSKQKSAFFVLRFAYFCEKRSKATFAILKELVWARLKPSFRGLRQFSIKKASFQRSLSHLSTVILAICRRRFFENLQKIPKSTPIPRQKKPATRDLLRVTKHAVMLKLVSLMRYKRKMQLRRSLL